MRTTKLAVVLKTSVILNLSLQHSVILSHDDSCPIKEKTKLEKCFEIFAHKSMQHIWWLTYGPHIPNGRPLLEEPVEGGNHRHSA
jgi:hypothetical protein